MDYLKQTEPKQEKKPKLWKYILVALIVFGFLAIWTFVSLKKEIEIIPDTQEEVVIEKQPSNEFLAEVTGYNALSAQTDATPTITASQKRVKDGMIACPRKYPFGTRFLIKGREYVCEDRMHIRNDEMFDIFFESYGDAMAFGRQRLLIKLAEEKN